MLFNSLQFIFIFLPIVLLVASRLKGEALMIWISLSSFVFYSFAGHAWFLIPMLVTTCLDFALAKLIFKARSRPLKMVFLLTSLVGNLGLLFVFKYSNLMAHTFVDVATILIPGRQAREIHWISAIYGIVLPAGISFYTFQTVSYIIDVYRGNARPEDSFWRFSGFVSFFPHLVAGPLTRHDQLIPALKRIEDSGIKPLWKRGVFLFAIGLCKKILIADRIAHFIDPMLAATGSLTLVSAWLCVFGYMLQIYFDFSGYSDMAIGLARLFSIELPQNFDSPYKSLSPVEFWRRWHITLSTWLRDYLYIPLGGSRCSKLRTNFNLMMTMFLGGLWHGANWTFAAWGIYHGVLLMVFHKIDPHWNRLPKLVQRASTFLLIAWGWVLFRAANFTQALQWFSRLLGAHGIGLGGISSEERKLLLLVVIGLFITQKFKNASHSADLEGMSAFSRVTLGLGFSLAVLLLSVSSRFLYFQF